VFLEATRRWKTSSEGMLCSLSAVGECFWAQNGSLTALQLLDLKNWSGNRAVLDGPSGGREMLGYGVCRGVSQVGGFQ